MIGNSKPMQQTLSSHSPINSDFITEQLYLQPQTNPKILDEYV